MAVHELRYGALGSLEVHRGGVCLAVERPRRRAVLAYLLLHANRFVTTEQLIDAVWGEEPPPSARGQVHTALSELRRLLGTGGPGPITSRSGSYRLAVEESAFDVTVFQRAVAEARRLAAAGDHGGAARAVRGGLDLWRGTALAAVEAPFADTARTHLEEQRFEACELLADAELGLGRHQELVPFLTAVLDDYPTREGIAERLALALYRSGRQADALAAFERVRVRLAEELGIDPGPALRTLHQRLLTADPALLWRPDQPPAPAPPPPAPTAPAAPAASDVAPGGIPAQLPADTPDFTGRQAELEQLSAVLRDAATGGPRRVVVVSGMGGVGKTALAVHAAQRMSHLFPDGQLYVDLRGFGAGRPRDAYDVLAGFLADLAGTGATGGRARPIPEDTGDRAALLRTALAGRRVLLLLDNARDAAQVIPLLPGNSACAVIVTSRNTLTDLPGAVQLPLAPLDMEDQRSLLSALLGPGRVQQDSDGAMRILAACAGLPLALRISGARLSARPAWSLTALAQRMDEGPGRLRALKAGHLAVHATFASSYLAMRGSEQAIEREAARAFRLLGLWPRHVFGVEAAAALLGCAPDAAADLLELLADAHLLESPGPLRYRFHDLLGEYAAERAAEEEPAPVRDAARVRLMVWYAAALDSACAATGLCGQAPPPLSEPLPAPLPAFGDPEQALRWCARELANVREAIRQAADCPRPELAWRLAGGLFGYARTYWWTGQWDECLHQALRIAEDHGDLLGQAWTLRRLGACHGMAYRNEQAAETFSAALAICERLGDEAGRASILGNLSIAHGQQGRPEQALAYARTALDLLRRTGDSRGEVAIVNAMAMALLMTGDLPAAEAHFRRALDLCRSHGNRTDIAIVLGSLGDTLRGLGRREDAFAALDEAQAIHRQLGDVAGLTHCLVITGRAHLHYAQWDQARACFQQAADLSREHHLPTWTEQALEGLAQLERAMGGTPHR